MLRDMQARTNYISAEDVHWLCLASLALFLCNLTPVMPSRWRCVQYTRSWVGRVFWLLFGFRFLVDRFRESSVRCVGAKSASQSLTSSL